MIRGVVGQFEPEELTNRKAVSASPSDPALGLDPFKIANKEHAKVNARWNPGATTDLAVVGNAELLDPSIEACLLKQLIEFRIECVSVRTGRSTAVMNRSCC
jgi:hypothetical protein